MTFVTLQAGNKALMPQGPMSASALRFLMAVAIIALPLGGCSSISNTLGGLFGGDPVTEDSSEAVDTFAGETAQNSIPDTGFVFGGDAESRPRFSAPQSGGQGVPDLNTVPSSAPTPSPQGERDRAFAGLIADRANSRHTTQGARTMPVAVRPLEPGTGGEAGSTAPPMPELAAVDPVTRLGDVPPPRPVEAGETVPEAPVSATTKVADVALSPSPPARPATSSRPASTRTLSSLIAGNESSPAQTTLVARFRPLSNFNSAIFAVSSHIASFPSVARGLSPEDHRVLQDSANLRSDVQGVLRVVGHGGSEASGAAILAVRVAEALMVLGVPAERLYVGADAASGPVELFLDY